MCDRLRVFICNLLNNDCPSTLKEATQTLFFDPNISGLFATKLRKNYPKLSSCN